MKLIEALKNRDAVLVMFVDVHKDSQWSITFNQPTELAQFLTPMVGELKENETITPQKPFKYYKVIFVSENPPEHEEEEEDPRFVAQA